jgi:hypothetical protein
VQLIPICVEDWARRKVLAQGETGTAR